MRKPLPEKALIAGVFLLFVTLGACANTDTYPISGQECGPDDPVKDLQAADCMPV